MYFKKEESIREARMIEATRKRLMGSSGKIGCVVRNMGQPIIASGSPNYDVSYLDDPFKIHDPDEILTMDEDDISYQMGWHFDGLSRGMNLEIKYLEDGRDLIVRYKGQVVYREISGELHGYAPFDEWEEKIDRLYEAAMKIENEKKKKRRKDQKEIAEKRSQELLKKMQLKWGI